MDGLACNEQIYKGKEKEAVLEMLPYLRLGNLSDPNEMESVNFAQGPVCPVSFHPLIMVYSGLMKEADMQSSKNNFSNAWARQNATGCLVCEGALPRVSLQPGAIQAIQCMCLLNSYGCYVFTSSYGFCAGKSMQWKGCVRSTCKLFSETSSRLSVIKHCRGEQYFHS